MTKRMLIDATHPEETRVVVLNGKRLDEFDFETSTKKQLKGNIYLAKVTRVEPSLQAAFVEFGGNRHGFLAFSEIHPDYYQIPVADRAALLREYEEDLAAEAAAEAAEDDKVAAAEDEIDIAPPEPPEEIARETPLLDDDEPSSPTSEVRAETGAEDDNAPRDLDTPAEPEDSAHDVANDVGHDAAHDSAENNADDSNHDAASLAPDTEGDDEADAHHDERPRTRTRRHRYKIQEVIKRRQILLIQVVKEERGNKGAALTTYLSLAGRYCVLMPNTAKGGGISRKITSAGDRKRLKSLISDLEIPDGMAVILRTAAVERSKAELKRDFEFLMRAWDLVRELTLKSIAPTLVYEEASLIKRSIRDLYTKDIDEVLVDGDEGYKTAKEFMRMLMPSHAKKVQPYRDPEIPLFHRYQVEAQLDAMHSAQVQLKSGGYIVINPTEALVSIDVNSGRATRERNIEETAYKTNLEAADEIARQLRLRDLAGLIVIDFIDMAEHRNQHTVERRIKEAMRNDRARIQIGRISAFGLLELSRQRLRPSLLEASTQPCAHCHGTGLIRSTESAALHILRAIEEEGTRRRSIELRIAVATTVALYVLNQKRDMLRAIENRYGFRVLITGDDRLITPDFELERVEGRPVGEAPRLEVVPVIDPEDEDVVEDETDEDVEETAAPPRPVDDEEERGTRRRRRRGRGRGRRDDAPDGATPTNGDDAATTPDAASGSIAVGEATTESAAAVQDQGEAQENGDGSDGEKPKRRRRGRRGGRRRGRTRDGEAESDQTQTDESHAEFATDTGTDTTLVTEAAPQATPQATNGASAEPVARPAPESAFEPVPQAAPQPDVTTPEVTAPEVAAKAEGPRRKGWWNRFGS